MQQKLGRNDMRREACRPEVAALKQLVADALRPGSIGPEHPLPTNHQELHDLVKRHHQGDDTALPAVREMLRTIPEEAIKLFSGDLAANNATVLLNRFVPNPAMREATLGLMEKLRADLCGDSPTPLERFLVDHLVQCWLAVQVANLLVTASDVGVGQSRGVLKGTDAAHKRLLEAARTLGMVRRMALPELRLHLSQPASASTAAAG